MNIIQDTWNETDDQDLLSFLSNPVRLSALEILKITDFSTIKVIFADTTIMFSLLKQTFDNYPIELNKFYHRNINVYDLPETKSIPYPYFAKPFSNDKSFEAHIIRNDKDYDYFISEASGQVYVSELVEFVNEYRLFIGDNKIVGCVESSDFLIDPRIIKRCFPPSDFLNDILRFNPYNYCIIDVGMFNDTWSIVEVNPPYSITSYGLDIELYYAYCRDAFTYLKSQLKTRKLS